MPGRLKFLEAFRRMRGVVWEEGSGGGAADGGERGSGPGNPSSRKNTHWPEKAALGQANTPNLPGRNDGSGTWRPGRRSTGGGKR